MIVIKYSKRNIILKLLKKHLLNIGVIMLKIFQISEIFWKVKIYVEQRYITECINLNKFLINEKDI